MDYEALLQAITERSLLELGDMLGKAREATAPVATRPLHAVAIAYCQWALAHPRLYRILFLDEQPPPIAQSVSAQAIAAAAQLVGEEQAMPAAMPWGGRRRRAFE